TDKQADYAESVKEELEKAGLRVELDNRNESLGYRLRVARNARDSYICIIGEKEAETKSVTVRASKIKDEIGNMPVEEFKTKVLQEIEEKLVGSIFEEK
ncbi:MAG: threonine--tRNA ligase, partial [Firmicutes bacterium]|nr:threonine--tRNA ligase [Bacillota bacterium]